MSYIGMHTTILGIFGAKIICIFLYLFLILFMMTGCIESKDEVAAELIIDYEIPFLTSSRFYEFQVIDRDSYGRALYKYSSQTSMKTERVFEDFALKSNLPDASPYEICVMMVCQKVSRNQIYFYETDCYTFIPTFSSEPENIEEFLMLNDWGKPLDKEKMVEIEKNRRKPFIVVYLMKMHRGL